MKTRIHRNVADSLAYALEGIMSAHAKAERAHAVSTREVIKEADDAVIDMEFYVRRALQDYKAAINELDRKNQK